ncbi:PREDICTED: uncharacterized protein LOC104808828 isoform X2 [Tarenaya hassleriana]|uniref:uncharacterized protein LOC104808828 isoform X2 n=1 Tax=Tarenaya hassleriana TaxID=28532 RepID=UPI00053C1D80|nr:PREDICTED: uncharacterized protein LOC104808828 isoform X2 [Tarenaya hassleriana]
MTGTRRKTLVRRARIQNSPQTSDSAGDVNGGSGFQGDKGTRGKSPEAHEKDNDGGDGLIEKSPILGDNEAGDIVDGLKSDACIVCDGEDNKVLLCHETVCPVSIHRRCLPDEPNFDELGNFYCPYCWYKRLVVKSLRLQEKVMEAEKCLKARENSVGVDMAVTMDRNDEPGYAIKVNISLDRMKSLNPCENRREDGELDHGCVELQKNQQNETVAAETHDQEVSDNEDRAQGQDSDVVEGRKRRRKSSDPYGNQSHREEEENAEREPGADPGKDDEVMNEQDNGFGKDGEAKPDIEPSISSPVSTNADNESDTSNQEFALVMRPKVNVREQPTEARPSSSKKPLFESKKLSRGNKRYQEKRATEYHVPKQRKDDTNYGRKRKPLYWTPEEEETLRVAVDKVSRAANRNMPWRKVLEFGRDKFQEGRIPSDLKEKWKKMNKM